MLTLKEDWHAGSAGDRSSVLITGAAGFIGGHLTRALRAEGMTVRTVDDLRETPLMPPIGDLMVKRVSDLAREDVEGADVVYHLASDKSVPLSFEMPLQYLENIEAADHLLRLCAEVGVPRVVLASTCEVYGRARVLPTPEGEAPAPLSPYAASKAAIEMIAQIYRRALRRGSHISIARFFNVYGPGERPDAVIPRFCLGAMTDGRLPVEGAGTQRRDFSYIDDVVSVLRALPHADPVPVINVGSGRPASVLEIAEIVKEFCPHAEIAHSDERPNEIQEFRSDTGLQRRLFGRRSGTCLRAGIQKTLEWWSEAEGLRAPQAPGGDAAAGRVADLADLQSITSAAG